MMTTGPFFVRSPLMKEVEASTKLRRNRPAGSRRSEGPRGTASVSRDITESFPERPGAVREQERRQRPAPFFFHSGLAADSPRQPCGQHDRKKRREERASGGAAAAGGIGAPMMETLSQEPGERDGPRVADDRPRRRAEGHAPRPKLAVEKVFPKTLFPGRPHALQQLGGVRHVVDCELFDIAGKRRQERAVLEKKLRPGAGLVGSVVKDRAADDRVGRALPMLLDERSRPV